MFSPTQRHDGDHPASFVVEDVDAAIAYNERYLGA
jgi:hypothetical protein